MATPCRKHRVIHLGTENNKIVTRLLELNLILHKILFRPLKPIRVPRNTVTVKDVDEVSILVSVVRAYDVPIRRELDKGTITIFHLIYTIIS